jgi:hypothetical protein
VASVVPVHCAVPALSLQDSIIEEVQQDFGPRLCTVLLYLNDVPEGGETAFAGTGRRLRLLIVTDVGLEMTVCISTMHAAVPQQCFGVWRDCLCWHM